MELREEQDKVSQLLKETICLLCKSSLRYDFEFCVEGLIGVTVDRKEVFLINLKEGFTDSSYQEPDSGQRDKPGAETEQEANGENQSEHEEPSRIKRKDQALYESSSSVTVKTAKKRKATDSESENEFAAPSFQDMDSEDVWQGQSSDRESDHGGAPQAKRRAAGQDEDSNNSEEREQANEEEDAEDTSHQSFITGVKAVKMESEESDDDIIIVKEEIDDAYFNQATLSASSTQKNRSSSTAMSQSQFSPHTRGPVPMSMVRSPGNFHQPSTSGFADASSSSQLQPGVSIT